MRALTGLLIALSALAQTQAQTEAQTPAAPSVSNGRVQTMAFAGDLSAQIRSSGPAWFGYAVKTKRGDHGCCWNGGGCALEDTHSGVTVNGHADQPVQLEGSDTLALLFRVENDRVEKIRAYSLACPLDAGGLPFTWITNVPAAQSIGFLDKLIHAASSNSFAGEAVFALSVHDDPIALDTLIQLAKADGSAHVREQALFWLAQRAGARAVETITNAVLNDPDTNVKRRAVFALSQLPHEEGVPKLIEIARTQRNPEVRKQAFFWLGQSKDPRALSFFEEVLSK